MHCSNPEKNLTSELCVVFDIKTRVYLNITVQDFDLYTTITDALIDSVQITKDNVGMDDRDYQKMLQHILNYGIANYNYVNQGVPVSLNSTSKFEPVVEEITSMRLSPYVQDQFYFLGFDALSHVQPSGLLAKLFRTLIA